MLKRPPGRGETKGSAAVRKWGRFSPGTDLWGEPAGFLGSGFKRTRSALKDARGKVRGKSVTNGCRKVRNGWPLVPVRVPVVPGIGLQTFVRCFWQ